VSSLTAIAKALQEKLGCAAACAVAHQEQDFLHPTGPPRPRSHHFAESLTEDGLFTFPVATSPSTQSQSQRHPLALNRKILQLPPVTTVASGRLRSARRALRSIAVLGTDEPTLLGFFEPNKVRPFSGGSNSCALNSLDMVLSLDDQVHVPAP
jgi:hypothetical protein